MQSNCDRRVWASFGLLLLLVTWRLWIPQIEFPQIPFFAALVDVPPWADWIAVAVVVVSLLVAVFSEQEIVWRRALIAFASAMLLLVLLNQHRFQPWAYQFILFATIMANCRASIATHLMRWIVVSIYVYSGISKLDYQFLHSLGPQFLSALTSYLGVASAAWPEGAQVWSAMMFPIGELAVGIGLLLSRTRAFAVFFAIALHAVLLLILGPWGLSHQPGVLVWNLFFIAQAWMLFAKPHTGIAGVALRRAKVDRKNSEGKRSGLTPQTVSERLCVLLTGIVLAFPASESLGYCDHWPAWEVYSPRSSRVQIAIHDSAVDRLPPKVQRRLAPAGEEDDWRQLHIDRWSLESLSVPIYPEDRFQVGIALALADQYELGLAIHVVHQGPSHRWTGRRDDRVLVGHDQLRAASGFRLNVEARPWGLDAP